VTRSPFVVLEHTLSFPKMPRARGRRPARNQRRAALPDGCTIKGKVIQGITLVAGQGSYAVAPTIATRLADIEQAFEFYRFTSLRFRVFPSVGAGLAADGNTIVAYVPEETTVAVTFAKLVEQTYSIFMPQATITSAGLIPSQLGQSIPSRWMTIPARVLNAQGPKWYKTVGPTAEDPQVQQGALYLSSDNIADVRQFYLEVEYVCQFQGSEKTTLQP
jgi:hypothetical protein